MVASFVSFSDSRLDCNGTSSVAHSLVYKKEIAKHEVSNLKNRHNMQEDYDFDWNLARRSKSKMSLFSATSSPSSKAGPGTVNDLTIFSLKLFVNSFTIHEFSFSQLEIF